MLVGDRTIRIELLEGGEIEISRFSSDGQAREKTNHDNLEAALVVIEMLVRAAYERAIRERFEPQIIKEGMREYKRLEAQRNGSKS